MMRPPFSLVNIGGLSAGTSFFSSLDVDYSSLSN